MLTMIEIFVLLLATLFLARHPKRRRYSLRAVRITPARTLTTLGAATAIIASLTGTSGSSYRAVSVKGVWTLTGLTAGEGPITVGYSHGDYSTTEIKEYLESATSINVGLKVEQEKSRRLIRVVGTFASSGNAALNNGNPIKTRLNWLITETKNVSLFVWNEGTGALTTGASVNMVGTMWVKDNV